MHGTQTAIVVGAAPVLTDRDHRIKLQFHWQRGGHRWAPTRSSVRKAWSRATCRRYFGKSTASDSEHAKFPKGHWDLEYAALAKLSEPTKKEGEKESEKK